MKQTKWYRFIFIIAFMVLTGILAGCAQKQDSVVELKMAPVEDMPIQIQQSPVTVQQAYQFNIANPEIMQQIPCYCGCGAMGHKSNYNCYAQGVDAQGNVVYDGHALGCSICVDITHDTMRLLKQGKTVDDILLYVDDRYSQYGPPTTP